MTALVNPVEHRTFIGGSHARTIMGDDEASLVRLWREERGELEPEDLSANLIVQLGAVTEGLNRLWFQRNSGQTITDVQRRIRHPVLRWMGATLDGMVERTGAVFETKFMLPWSFSEEAAAEKHMPQIQHNMWVTNVKAAVAGRTFRRGSSRNGYQMGSGNRLLSKIGPVLPQISHYRMRSDRRPMGTQ